MSLHLIVQLVQKMCTGRPALHTTAPGNKCLPLEEVYLPLHLPRGRLRLQICLVYQLRKMQHRVCWLVGWQAG